MCILALVLGFPLAWWNHKEAQQESARGVVTEKRTTDLQGSDSPTNIFISRLQEARNSTNLDIAIKAMRTDEQDDYFATHILDWPTNSLSLNPLEFLEKLRALDIETTNAVLVWNVGPSLFEAGWVHRAGCMDGNLR